MKQRYTAVSGGFDPTAFAWSCYRSAEDRLREEAGSLPDGNYDLATISFLAVLLIDAERRATSRTTRSRRARSGGRT